MPDSLIIQISHLHASVCFCCVFTILPGLFTSKSFWYFYELHNKQQQWSFLVQCCCFHNSTKKMKETSTRQNLWSKKKNLLFLLSCISPLALLHHETWNRLTKYVEQQSRAGAVQWKEKKSVSFRWIFKRMRKLWWWRFSARCQHCSIPRPRKPFARERRRRELPQDELEFHFVNENNQSKTDSQTLSRRVYKKLYRRTAMSKYLGIIYQTQKWSHSPYSSSSSSCGVQISRNIKMKSILMFSILSPYCWRWYRSRRRLRWMRIMK